MLIHVQVHPIALKGVILSPIKCPASIRRFSPSRLQTETLYDRVNRRNDDQCEQCRRNHPIQGRKYSSARSTCRTQFMVCGRQVSSKVGMSALGHVCSDPAKRADGSRRSPALVRSSPRPGPLRSATGARSAWGARSCGLDRSGTQTALDRRQHYLVTTKIAATHLRTDQDNREACIFWN
jgi:hypothetical protein